MPTVDIDVDDFLWSCSNRDIKDLIKALVEDEHLPKNVLGQLGEGDRSIGRGEEEFSKKLEIIKTKYYSLTQEEEEFFERLFKKYL